MVKKFFNIWLCLAVVLATTSGVLGQALPCIANTCGNLDCKYWATSPSDVYCLWKSEEACLARGACDKNLGICFNLKKVNGDTVREPTFANSCTQYTTCSTLNSCQKCPTPIGSGATGCTQGAYQDCVGNSTMCGPCQGLCGSPAAHVGVSLLVQLAVLALAVLVLW